MLPTETDKRIATTPLIQVCIHGHFYQPPRENPFTGEVPPEPGAEPFSNFNEKINAECYRPNAVAGNFERISFNFGPTLASWLEQNDPETYNLIIAGDRVNYERYGYGNALAQVYNHVIMPLARPEDARMQIEWGIADFERRFGHKPEGMWLAETAVNSRVMEMLADAGIKFTILAPWQARHDSVTTIDSDASARMQELLRTQIIRDLQYQFHGDNRLNTAALRALERVHIPEQFDPSEAYQVPLRGGRSMIVFFYNAPLSGGISFDQWATTNADGFARDWILPQVNLVKVEQREPQMITIATDGELYGHHQTYRDLFLQHLTSVSLPQNDLGLTFPSQWLRSNPPRRMVRLVENTSWSCFHGVRRWSTGCECTSGDSAWKNHLRHAFDILADEVDRVYAQRAPRYFTDPQAALRDWLYVSVHHGSEEEFAARHLTPELRETISDKEWDIARRLLKAQVYKHEMYTSCAWFFEDIDRIEPKNALAAASITFRLLGQFLQSGVRKAFEEELALARSNRPQHFTGLQLYRKGVNWSLRHAHKQAESKEPSLPA